MHERRQQNSATARASAIAATTAALLAATAHAQPDAAVLTSVEACEPDARAWLARLVAIDSGSANIAGLEAMSTTLTPELERLGARVERVPSTDSGYAASLLATWTGTGRGRVLLIAHMDTVFLPGTAAERPFRIEGSRGIGPGAGDDKQGIVAALCALRALNDIGFRDYARIALVLNSNEETGSTGSSDLIAREAQASDAVLNLERGVPPDGVVVARKGSAKMTLSITGRAAHSGLEPEKGRNAVVEAAHQIVKMEALADAASETTVNVTLIDGGTVSNVIPERATVTFDVRAFSAAELDRVEAGMRQLAAEVTVPGVEVKGTLERGFPPWARNAGTDALLARANEVYAELGRSLEGIVVGSSSDVSVAALTGTPSIDGFGWLAGGAHGVDDHADLTSMVPRTYLLTRLLMELGRDPIRR